MSGYGPRQLEIAADMSFLAPPGAVADWRRVLITSLADNAGILDGLPSTASELAGQLSLDPKRTREYAVEAASRGPEVTMTDLPSVIGSVHNWPRVRNSGIKLVASDVFNFAAGGPARKCFETVAGWNPVSLAISPIVHPCSRRLMMLTYVFWSIMGTGSQQW